MKSPDTVGGWRGIKGVDRGRPGFPENELVEFLGVHGRGNPLYKQNLAARRCDVAAGRCLAPEKVPAGDELSLIATFTADD